VYRKFRFEIFSRPSKNREIFALFGDAQSVSYHILLTLFKEKSKKVRFLAKKCKGSVEGRKRQRNPLRRNGLLVDLSPFAYFDKDTRASYYGFNHPQISRTDPRAILDAKKSQPEGL
jgi:hypothetical protein